MSKGTYVACDFSEFSSNELYTWVLKNKIPNPLDQREYHTTLLYSRVAVNKAEDIVDDLNYMEDIITVKPVSFSIFGKALVLVLDSTKLYRIHRLLINCGGTHDFEDYTPHITISYDIPEKFNIKKLIVPNIEFFVVGFKTEPLDDSKYD